MKNGLPTCKKPTDPEAYYMYVGYHEFWYGPFDDESALMAAIRHLDRGDGDGGFTWDYDGLSITHGINADAPGSFRGTIIIPQDQRDRIESQRVPGDVRLEADLARQKARQIIP